jgi:outer membrane immunogenic protein
MKSVLTVGLLLGTAVGASAADLAPRPYTKAPPMVAAIYDWTGFYVGVNAGGGVGRTRTQQNIPGVATDTVFQQPTGALGGVQVGYNWQTNAGFLGPVLFGVEADIQGADLRDSFTRTLGLGGLTAAYDQRIDWFGTVRGRIGLVTGSTVGYVTGGYAYGGGRSTVTETLGGATGAFSTNVRSGYTLGSGVEAALGGNWTAKIEYLYVDLGNRTDAFTLVGLPQTQSVRFRENIFRAGLNYKIGGAAWAPTPANWTGFYIGGNVGSAVSRDRTTTTVTGVPALTETFNIARDGYNGGAQIGYNWQASAWVFGVEGDFQGGWQRDRSTCVFTCSALLSNAIDAKLPWFATARGRLGYSVGSTLFYATGGYAVAEVNTRYNVNILGVTGQPSFSTTKSGWTVGAGIETPFTLLGFFGPNWTTKTEYLYADLGTVTNAYTVNATPFVTTQRVQEHIFRTGINYHFNQPVVARY